MGFVEHLTLPLYRKNMEKVELYEYQYPLNYISCKVILLLWRGLGVGFHSVDFGGLE